jgi:hypothetical protein
MTEFSHFSRSPGWPEVLASPVLEKRLRALRHVMPMSKHRPFTEYQPFSYQARYRRAWSSRSQPTLAILSARASAMLVSSVHSPGRRLAA